MASAARCSVGLVWAVASMAGLETDPVVGSGVAVRCIDVDVVGCVSLQAIVSANSTNPIANATIVYLILTGKTLPLRAVYLRGQEQRQRIGVTNRPPAVFSNQA